MKLPYFPRIFLILENSVGLLREGEKIIGHPDMRARVKIRTYQMFQPLFSKDRLLSYSGKLMIIPVFLSEPFNVFAECRTFHLM